MTKCWKYYDSDDVDSYHKDIKEAYELVFERFPEWNPNEVPEYAHVKYTQSSHMWHDIEEGTPPITLWQIQLATEFHDISDEDFFDYEQHRQYAGYNC